MLTQNWLARQCAISVPHSSMSGEQEGHTVLLSLLSTWDAAPPAASSLPTAPPGPTAVLTDAAVLVQHPAPLAAKAAGVLWPRAAPARPVALCGQGRAGWAQAGGSCLHPAPGQPPAPLPIEPDPLTYQHISGGSCFARPHSSHHRTRHRRGLRSPGCRRTGRCHGACRHHRIARCRCRAAGAPPHRLHGERAAGWQPGQGAAWQGVRPAWAPHQHPTSSPLMPQLLTPAVGAVGARWAAERQRVHTQPLEEVGVLVLPGEGGTWCSAPCHTPVHPTMSLSPDSLMEPPPLHVLLAPLQQLVAGEV